MVHGDCLCWVFAALHHGHVSKALLRKTAIIESMQWHDFSGMTTIYPFQVPVPLHTYPLCLGYSCR